MCQAYSGEQNYLIARDRKRRKEAEQEEVISGSATFKLHLLSDDTLKKIGKITKEDHAKLKASGMMWEVEPKYTGDFEKDVYL